MKATKFLSYIFIISIFFGLALPVRAEAAGLTVTPITWNVIGLDSNDPTVGPNIFPVGVRVCNTTSSTAYGVTADFAWVNTPTDCSGGNPCINLQSGSSSSIDLGDLAANACADAYYNVEVTQEQAAYDTTREYSVTASDSTGTVTGASPTPRQLYVEHLISQARNGFTDLKVDGTSVTQGGSMNFMVGSTYTIEVDGYTATGGYNQLSTFLNLTNTVYQILGVSTTYSADTSPYVSNPSNELYADACKWDNDPTDPNYNSCVGGDYKAGGTVQTTYTIKILSGAGTNGTISGLFYDFSGSSFHYDNDFSSFQWTANIVSPSAVTISKTFAPTADPSVTEMVLTLNNPTSGDVSDVNFADTFPTSPEQMTVASSPNATNTCGGSLYNYPGGTTISAADTGIELTGGTVPANGICTITVDIVTPSTVGNYTNTTGDLYIGTTDTGNFGSATLTVSDTQPPSSCATPVTLATWTIPVGSSAPPSPDSGSLPSDVSFATASDSLTTTTGALSSIVTGGVTTNAWEITDAWPSVAGAPGAGTVPYFQFSVDSTNYGGITISAQADLEPNGDWTNGNNNHIYIYGSNGGGYSLLSTTAIPKGSWQPAATGTAVTWGTTTSFRITADTRGSNKTTSSVLLDNITITGCPLPTPPTMTKSFNPATVSVGVPSTLTLTITNPNTDTADSLSALSFTDNLPAGLTIASTPNASTTCGSGTLTATAGATSISLSGGSLSANAAGTSSCTVTVDVTALTDGTYVNKVYDITTAETGTRTFSTPAQATLTAIRPPVITKAFSPDTILYDGTTPGVSTLTFVITNPNQNTTLTGVTFTDTFPNAPDMKVASPLNYNVTNCGAPAFSPVAGAGSITFSGGTIAAGGSCTVTVDVAVTATGTYANTSTVSDTAAGTGNTASASLTVNAAEPAISVLKQVATCSSSGTVTGNWLSYLLVPYDGTTPSYVCYQYTVENTGNVTLTAYNGTDVNVADNKITLPSGCDLGSTGTLAPSDSFTCVSDAVAVVSAGVTNTATATGYYGSSPSTDTSQATYATTSLKITKTFTDSAGSTQNFAGSGDVLTYTYVVKNTSSSASLTLPVTVTDDMIPSVNCPTASGPLAPGASVTCTATYTATSSDVLNGNVTNTAYALTSDSPQVKSNTVIATANYHPTLVVLTGFGAYEEDGGVVVWWKTASEINTLGFNVLRLDSSTGQYNTVNSGLLPAVLNPHHGGNYSLRDPGAVPGGTYTYKLVEVELSGNKRTYGPFTVYTGYAPAAGDPAIPAGLNYQRLERASPGYYAVGKAAKRSRKVAVAAPTVLVGDRIKISVTADGLYYVDANDIASMLGISYSKASGMIAHNTISLSNRGNQVAYLPAENDSGLYFYGQHLDSVYTDENVYWLDTSKGTAMTVLDGAGPLSQGDATSFLDTEHFEQNVTMWQNLVNDPNADYWFWSQLYASSGYTYPPASFTFELADLDPAATTCTVQVNLFGGNVAGHDVTVSLNGQSVDGKWSGLTPATVTGTFPLITGDNTLTVEAGYDPGSASFVLIDSFDVTYPRLYQADGDSLSFRGDGAPTVTVGGFSSPDIMVFDLSDPLMPKLVEATTIGATSASGTTTYSVSLFPASADTPYLAVAGGGIQAASASAVVSSNLSSSSNAADYIVIAPAELVSTAQGLADYRSGQGLKTMVVNLDDIMNEFNYGIFSPEAIKTFLETAYSNWKTPPRYVVLAGDGSADYKGYILKNYPNLDPPPIPCLIPPRMVPTDNGLAASDNYFVDFNGDHVPEMAIGRLPVADADELQTVIKKIETHEKNLGVNDAILVADTPDEGGDFNADIDNLAELFPQGYTVHKIYLSDSGLVAAKNALIADINSESGTAFFNYVGHAAPEQLSDSGLLMHYPYPPYYPPHDDLPLLKNASFLPTMTAMTCTLGNFSDPYWDILSAAMLLKPDGGVAAVWSASSLSDDSQADILSRAFYNAVFSDGKTVLGDAVLQALSVYSQEGISPEMMDIYNVLGDPAMRLR